MSKLIAPSKSRLSIPGELTIDSLGLGWRGVHLCGCRYTNPDVRLPGQRNNTIAVCSDGKALVNRHRAGGWQSEIVVPGTVAVLPHSTRSHWRLSEPIEVLHIHLSPATLAKVAAEVSERDVADVELHDVLKIDTVLEGIARALAIEISERGIGGALYVEALKIQACIRLLRHYSTIVFKAKPPGGLSAMQRHLILQYVNDHLTQNIRLVDLASMIGLSVFQFSRRFRGEFGCSPHAYVLDRRMEHAKRQLARADVPLKVVAADAGFADQSHMTRLFKRLLNVTPADYRRQLLK